MREKLGMTLRAATLLGDNTISILTEVVVQIQSAGLDIEFDPSQNVGQPDLLFACGLLTAEMISRGETYQIFAAPLFPGESMPVYRSVMVGRPGVMAVNEFGSWSGWRAYLEHAGRPEELMVSGSHRQSLDAILEGTADFAAIDSSIWNHELAHDIRLKGLDVFAETIDWPAPPFSVSTSLDSAVSELLVNALLGCLSLIPTDFATYEPMLGSSGS
jgi:hypothetical protein